MNSIDVLKCRWNKVEEKVGREGTELNARSVQTYKLKLKEKNDRNYKKDHKRHTGHNKKA